MIVVADTSPINYLALIDEINLLPALYGEVIIPEAVFRELRHSNAPLAVQDFLAENPTWLKVRRVSNVVDIALGNLDIGEREAIQLAQEINAETVLIDDNDGRQAAQKKNLNALGTLGILNAAASGNLIDLATALEKLQKTNFRAAPALIRQLLENDAKHRKNSSDE